MEAEEFEECVQKLKELYEIAIETVGNIEDVKKESAVKFKKAVDFIYKTVNKTE